MKISSYSAPVVVQKKVSFGDDPGYIPNSFRVENAMEQMSKEGYIVRGTSTKDAFERLYTDVDGVLLKTSRRPDAITIEQARQTSSIDRNIKYMVEKWEMTKSDFSNMMTSFWNGHKNKVQEKNVIYEFLAQHEGLSKPNFFQRFTSKYQNYMVKENILENVIKFFLKNGKHGL